jgi:hypothetical protein
LCQLPLAGDLDLFALDRDKAGAAKSAGALPCQGRDSGRHAAGTDHDDAALEGLLPQQAVKKQAGDQDHAEGDPSCNGEHGCQGVVA